MSGAAQAQTSTQVLTLFVEDDDSLRLTVSERWYSQETPFLIISASVGDALHQIRGRLFGRVIADLTFDHETNTGLDVLDAAKSRVPQCDLILLTGQTITREIETRVKSLGATVLKKNVITHALIAELLSGKSQISIHAPSPDVDDIAELRLRMEDTEANVHDLTQRLSNASQVIQMLVGDILVELDDLPDSQKKRFWMGGRMLSPADLKREILLQTELGREVVRLHHELYKELRRR